MIHNAILALCIAAALAVLSALLRTMIGNKVDPHGGVFPGHTFLHTFDRYVGRKRHSASIVVGTPSKRSLPGAGRSFSAACGRAALFASLQDSDEK